VEYLDLGAGGEILIFLRFGSLWLRLSGGLLLSDAGKLPGVTNTSFVTMLGRANKSTLRGILKTCGDDRNQLAVNPP
jgi:hypothetical protein